MTRRSATMMSERSPQTGKSVRRAATVTDNLMNIKEQLKCLNIAEGTEFNNQNDAYYSDEPDETNITEFSEVECVSGTSHKSLSPDLPNETNDSTNSSEEHIQANINSSRPTEEELGQSNVKCKDSRNVIVKEEVLDECSSYSTKDIDFVQSNSIGTQNVREKDATNPEDTSVCNYQVVHKPLKELIYRANKDFYNVDSHRVKYKAGLSKNLAYIPSLHPNKTK